MNCLLACSSVRSCCSFWETCLRVMCGVTCGAKGQGYICTITGSNHMDFSGSPVDPWIVFCQPGVSENDVVLLSQVQHEEVLYCLSSVNPQDKLDLMSYHSFRIMSAIGIASIQRMAQFFQWPFHSLSEVKVDTTDCYPTVDQSSGLSDFSIFCFVKSHGNSDCSSQCCYKYGPNVCEKQRH